MRWTLFIIIFDRDSANWLVRWDHKRWWDEIRSYHKFCKNINNQSLSRDKFYYFYLFICLFIIVLVLLLSSFILFSFFIVCFFDCLIYFLPSYPIYHLSLLSHLEIYFFFFLFFFFNFLASLVAKWEMVDCEMRDEMVKKLK